MGMTSRSIFWWMEHFGLVASQKLNCYYGAHSVIQILDFISCTPKTNIVINYSSQN